MKGMFCGFVIPLCLIFIVIGCGGPGMKSWEEKRHKQWNPEYQEGDVVQFKTEDIKAIVSGYEYYQFKYKVEYFNKEGDRRTILVYPCEIQAVPKGNEDKDYYQVKNLVNSSN